MQRTNVPANPGPLGGWAAYSFSYSFKDRPGWRFGPTRSLGHDLGHDGPLGTLRWIIGGHRDRKRQRHRGSRGGGAAGVLVLAVPSMEDPECRGAETPNARESVSKERAAEQAGGAMILTGLPDGWMGQQGTGGAALLEAGQLGPPLLPCRFGH